MRLTAKKEAARISKDFVLLQKKLTYRNYNGPKVAIVGRPTSERLRTH